MCYRCIRNCAKQVIALLGDKAFEENEIPFHGEWDLFSISY